VPTSLRFLALLINAVGLAHPGLAEAPQHGPKPASPHLCDYSSAKTPESYNELERACIAKDNLNIEREGDRLTLRFANGKVRHFVGHSDCDDNVDRCRYFTYLGFIRASNAMVVQGSCYEFCGDTYLINATDGREVPLAWLPDISPDGQKLIATKSQDAESITTGLFPIVELYEFSDGWLSKSLEIGYRQDRYYSWTVNGWVGNAMIDVSVMARGSGCEEIEGDYKIIKVGDVWQVVPEPPCK
jgi:hypothetical protein